LVGHHKSGHAAGYDTYQRRQQRLFMTAAQNPNYNHRQHQERNQPEQHLIVAGEIQSAQIVLCAGATDLFPWQKEADENNERCANVYSSQHVSVDLGLVCGFAA
jgi:hypothetical protein